MLHRAVHEHGAAAAQVHRAVRKQTQGGKLLDIITQGLGFCPFFGAEVGALVFFSFM